MKTPHDWQELHLTRAEIRARQNSTCAYVIPPAAGRCGAPAVGEIDSDYAGHPPLCEEHLRPEAHPDDLRPKLKRWADTAVIPNRQEDR